MKKIFLFVFVFFCFSATCLAQRIDVTVDSQDYKIHILKAKVLKHSSDKSNTMLNFYYEPTEQAVYVSTHGDADGRLYLQKSKYTKETVAQCIDRLLKENGHLFTNLNVRKVYLTACYEKSRHRDNQKNLYIGHSDFLNTDIYEISYFCGKLRAIEYVKSGYLYSIQFDSLYANPLRDKDKYKLAKKAAEENSASWAVELLKDSKEF